MGGRNRNTLTSLFVPAEDQLKIRKDLGLAPQSLLLVTAANLVGKKGRLRALSGDAEVEKTALVRHASRMFVTGANVDVPMCTIVLRKGYGLGAQAMARKTTGR